MGFVAWKKTGFKKLLLLIKPMLKKNKKKDPPSQDLIFPYIFGR